MRTTFFHRVGIWTLILALTLVAVPSRPVQAARVESNPSLSTRGAPAPLLPGCPATTVTTFSNTTLVAVPAGPGSVTSTISVSGADPYLWDLNLQTFLQHTFSADVDLSIQSPAGTIVTLTTDNGTSFDNVFDGTLWDDSANDPATDHVYTNMITASSLSPEEPLAAFIGEDPNGDWVLTIADDLAFDGGSLNSWSLMLTTAPAIPIVSNTTFSNTTPMSVPSGPGSVTSTISVSGADPYLWDLNLQTFLQHTFSADVDLSIQSPGGTTVTLTTDNGAGFDNVFDGTLWDDSANDPASDHVYTNMVTASPLSPEEPLAAFIGEDPNGDWILTIADDLAGDGGSLNGWSLMVGASNGCAPALTIISTHPSSNATLTSLTSILVNFSGDVIGDGSPKAANNIANYALVEQGANRTFDTVTCAAGLAGDDQEQAIASATYDSTTLAATLKFTNRLAKGKYRLFICGTTSIWSAAGRELNDGANDTMVDFSITPRAASSTASEVAALPLTGFTPGRVTALPVQPTEKAYVQSSMTLEIPRLGVKMDIVGVPQIDGTWDVSWLGSQVGWLEGSAFPTWEGNSVITGHVWNADNTSGVFTSLKTLQYEDEILVHAFGQTFTYEVRESQRIDSASVQTVMKHEKLAWLTLLTCEDYRNLGDTYSGRRMVRAVLVSVK